MSRRGAFVILVLLVGCDSLLSPAEGPGAVGRGLPYADSLRAVLEYLDQHPQQSENTLPVKYAAALAYAIGRQDPDSARKLIEKYLPIATAYPTSCETHSLYNSLAYISIFQGKTDSAYQIIERNTHLLENIGGCYSELGLAYHLQGILAYMGGNTDTAISRYHRAIYYRETAKDLRGLGDSYNNLATVYLLRGDYTTALAYHEKALQARIQIRDSQGIADSYANIANIHHHKGLYPAALDNYLKAAAIFEKIKDLYALTLIWTNIGGIYRLQKQHAEARSYIERAIPLQESIKAYQPLASAYNTLANIYLDQQNQDSALTYYQKSIEIAEAIGARNMLFSLYNNVAGIFLSKGDFASAIDYYRKCEGLVQKMGMPGRYGTVYANLAGVYLAMGQPYLAYPLLLRAEKIAVEAEERDHLSRIYKKLSLAESLIARMNHQPERYLASLNFYQKHVALQESLYNQDNVRMLERLQNQYAYEKKEAALRVEQERERLLAQANIRQREMQRNYSLIGLVVALVGIGVLLFLLRIIRRQRNTLQVVNAELEVANAELEATNDALETTNQALVSSNKALEESNKIIQAQKDVLEEKNRDILDSITYAKRIQEALLPSSEKWQALLPESFVLYLPRDIVAGDFYWLAETEEHIYVAVADATGHGVPGAFVSMICVTTLQKIIHEEGITSPASILMRSKELITAQLTQYDKRIRDGMDIALLQISRQNPLEITFSGANRPLWIYLPHEILEVPPTKQPIGYSEINRPFEEHRITLNPSAMLYLFTDGLTDQMGGPRGRKLMQKGLREYLLSIAHLSPHQQGESLRSFFEAWRGDHPQMDDVTIIGIRASEVAAINPALIPN